jgi:hypothetical protein
MRNQLKSFIKFFYVIGLPAISILLYAFNLHKIFSFSLLHIILIHTAVLLVMFNALFYSFHMSKTTMLSRFSISLAPAIGFAIALENSGNIQFLILCIGIEFKYKDLFGKRISKEKSGNYFKTNT